MMIEVPNFVFALREDLKDKLEFMPTRSDAQATGWDVRCAEPEGIRLYPFEHAKIRLGIRMFAPCAWWLELRPRSSTHAKKHLHTLYGVIDCTFENEILLSCQYIPVTIWTPQYDYTKPDGSHGDYLGYDCLDKGPYRRIIDGGYSLPDPGFLEYSFRNNPIYIKFGERIGQVRPVRRESMTIRNVSNEEYDKLCKERNSTRGTGGFGSTGD